MWIYYFYISNAIKHRDINKSKWCHIILFMEDVKEGNI